MSKKIDTQIAKAKTKQLEEETRLKEEQLRLIRSLKAEYNEGKPSKQMAFQIKTKKPLSIKNPLQASKTGNLSISTDDIPNQNTKALITDKEASLVEFLNQINQKSEAYLKVLKNADCYGYKDKLTKLGVETVDMLEECGTETLNSIGITRKKQIQLEKAIARLKLSDHISQVDEHKNDFNMQTDDLDDDIIQSLTNLAPGYVHNNNDVNYFIYTNDLEELGDETIDMNELLGLKPQTPNLPIIEPLVQNPKLPLHDPISNDSYAVCYTCFGSVLTDRFILGDNLFCSDICHLAYKNRQNEVDLKISEFTAQTERYIHLAEQTKLNTANVVFEPVIDNETEVMDVDLGDDIEVHYEGDRLLHKYN